MAIPAIHFSESLSSFALIAFSRSKSDIVVVELKTIGVSHSKSCLLNDFRHDHANWLTNKSCAKSNG